MRGYRRWHGRRRHSPCATPPLAESSPTATVTIADIPGRKRSMPAWPGARITLIPKRCATLVKLPVALSGGSNACKAPEAGSKLSTVPRNGCPARYRQSPAPIGPGYMWAIWDSRKFATTQTFGSGTTRPILVPGVTYSPGNDARSESCPLGRAHDTGVAEIDTREFELRLPCLHGLLGLETLRENDLQQMFCGVQFRRLLVTHSPQTILVSLSGFQLTVSRTSSIVLNRCATGYCVWQDRWALPSLWRQDTKGETFCSRSRAFSRGWWEA